MICPKCEKEYDDSFAFCPHCGETSPMPDQQPTQGQTTPAPVPPVVKLPGKPPSLSSTQMAIPSTSKHYPNASEVWQKLSTRGKVLVVGAGVLILAAVIVIAVTVQNSNKSQDTSTTHKTDLEIAKEQGSPTSGKTADDFLSLEITDGQQVNAGAAAVRGSVKSECSLTLDGQPVAIDPATKQFEAMVNLNEGQNTLTFNITDSSGQVYAKSLHITGVMSPAQPAPTPASASAVRTLEGNGNQATQTFNLTGGLAIFHMQYSGDGNFAVELMSQATGQEVELLANVVGSYSGSQVVSVSAGTYLFNVTASAHWTIGIEEPNPTSAPSTPLTFSGSTPMASGFFKPTSGLVTFTMNHQGDGNFSVQVLDENGNQVELPANEIGPYQGSQAVSLELGAIYILNVEANGPWTVQIQ